MGTRHLQRLQAEQLAAPSSSGSSEDDGASPAATKPAFFALLDDDEVRCRVAGASAKGRRAQPRPF